MSAHQKPTEIAYPPLPHEVEAEQACLGGCLLANLKIPEVQAACTVDDFYDPLHRRIAAAIFDIDRERRPVTPLTVKAALGHDLGLTEVGGHGYLVNLAQSAPTNPVLSARIVSDTAARRAAMIAIWDAQEALSRGDVAIVDILKPVVAASDRAAERSSKSAGSEGIGDAAYAFLRSLDHHEAEGTTTGLTDLDAMLGGLHGGNLYVVAGRPGMGKSAIASCIGLSAARAGAQVEDFSLEMPRRQLSARMVTDIAFDMVQGHEYPIQYSKLMRRKCGPNEVLRAMEAAEQLLNLPLTIHDRDSMTMADIVGLARARAAKANGKPGVIIIDHMHFIRPDDRYRGNQTQELGETAKAAKRLARALGWPVLLLAQLNRAIEQRPEKERMPTLADLRQSGEIEEAADVVMFIHRPAYYVEARRPVMGQRDPSWGAWLADMEPVRHQLNICVAKHRNGETGTVRAFVDIGANAIRDERRTQ